MTPTTITQKVTCPHCGADQVVQYSSQWPGLLLCLICKRLWQDDDEPQAQKKRKEKSE